MSAAPISTTGCSCAIRRGRLNLSMEERCASHLTLVSGLSGHNLITRKQGAYTESTVVRRHVDDGMRLPPGASSVRHTIAARQQVRHPPRGGVLLAEAREGDQDGD